jgi:hypothetical protein
MGGKKGFSPGNIMKSPVGALISPGTYVAEKGREAIGKAFKGAPKVEGFKMPGNLSQAEQQMIERQAAIAAGVAPSISELQYKQALDDSLKAQQSAVASAQGVSNAGLLQRQAMLQGQQVGLDIGRESSAARLAEQRGADQMIAAQAASQRGVALQQSLANQQAQTAQRQQNLAFIGNLGASAAAVSDETMKTSVKENKDDSSKAISEFMDAIKSYTYEYKKGAKQPAGKPNPDGEVKSVMAQDLEKSDIGKQMVTDTENGKVVDYAQGMAPLFAAIAELNKRTKKLEGK